MQILKGIPASEGIAIGPAFVYRPVAISVERRAVADTETELARFHAAIERSREQLAQVQHEAQATVGSDTAAIFEAHQMFLEDPTLLGAIEERISG